MRKKIIIIVILIISLVLFNACALVDCAQLWGELFEKIEELPPLPATWNYNEDGFCYRVMSEENKQVAVGTLEEKPESEVLFIPKIVNGYEVVKLGYRLPMQGDQCLISCDEAIEWYKRLYFPSSIQDIQSGYLTDAIKISKNMKYYYYCGKAVSFAKFCSNLSAEYLDKITIYISPVIYEDCLSLTLLENVNYETIMKKSNVGYYLNYNENSYYYVDYYENGEVVKYIPPIPEREGYTFGGWFKESECVDQWDFETDTVQTDENKEEVGLYAKWVKN